jgi:ubiquinone/menaquinone biosynthesis C-methylase UbiE
MNAIALDRDPAAIALAADRAVALERRLLLVRGTALRLPFRDQAVDLIAASMFCHHFFAGDLVALMRELTRVARVGVIINDLRRHPLAYWGYRALSRVFLRGHVVRHDGAISVLRGFVPQELAMLGSQFPEFRWSVRRRFAFRICLVGRRIARALT